jgi:hypothetical protein
MGQQPGEIGAREAAKILRVRRIASVFDYERRGLLTARVEPVGVLGRVRKWFRKAEVEALAAKGEGHDELLV